MTATRDPFARRYRPYCDTLWDCLESINELIAPHHRVVGWPDLGSTFVQQVTDLGQIGYIGRLDPKPVIEGPVRMHTRCRVFDVYDPPRDVVSLWGVLKPSATRCGWVTATLVPDKPKGKYTILTMKHRDAREASKVARVHPLEMIAKLTELTDQAYGNRVDDMSEMGELRTTVRERANFIGSLVERCATATMGVDVAMAASMFLECLDPALLTRQPFGLDPGIARAVAATKAGVV